MADNVSFGSKPDMTLRNRHVPLYPQKRTLMERTGMSALCGVFNRSTQHLLILLEEEVCDGGDCTDMVHAAAEG
jgi:hypothetical protein